MEDLPYFKFYVAEWAMGDISYLPYETQGVFINIVAHYWSKGCKIDLSDLKMRLKNADKEIDILIKNGIIKIKNPGDKIVIVFLDEQYRAQKYTKQKLRDAGKKGGTKAQERKRADSSQAQAGLKPGLSQAQAELKPGSSQAQAYRRDKKREEKNKKREDNIKKEESKIYTAEISEVIEYFLTFTGEAGRKIVEKEFDKCDYSLQVLLDKGYSVEKIKNAIKWAKADTFWCPQLLSPAKLAQKNKDGVLYVDYFLARAEEEAKPKRGNLPPGNPKENTGEYYNDDAEGQK